MGLHARMADEKSLEHGQGQEQALDVQAEELARVTASLEDARRAMASAADPEMAERTLALAEARRELFDAERDNTGAFKFKRFARELDREMAGDEEAGRPPGFELSPEGRIVFSPDVRRRQAVFISMGELDRFNKEGGGHAAGDAVLEETLRRSEAAIRDYLKKLGKPATFQLGRYGGNEFMAVFDGLAAAEAEELVDEIAALQPCLMDKEKVPPGCREGIEPAPLSVQRVGFLDVENTLNLIQAELGAGEKIESPQDVTRESIEVLRRTADWQLEAAKFATRAERVIEKVRAGDPGVENFFQSYMKKAFEGTPLATVEDFRKAVTDGSIGGLVARLAIEAARKRFTADRKASSAEEAIIQERAARHRIEPGWAGAGEAAGAGAGETHGRTVLRKKRELAEAARKEASQATGRDAKLKELDARQMELEYQIEASRRDMNTGLYERGVHYEDLERALAEGRETTVVFVDMGFLKYFDQMGGRDVGDRALQTAAVFMEQALENAGVSGKAYRYGGDEFTLQVEGGQAEAQKVIAELKKLQESEAAVIPAGRKSKPEYAASRLSFNYGMIDAKEGKELFDAVKKTGKWPEEDLADPKREANLRADVMTKAADAGVEFNKAVSRFHFLVREWREAADEADPDAQRDKMRRVMSLVNYSSKAIFSEDGGLLKLQELVTDRALGLDDVELDAAVSEFVVSRIERARAKDGFRKEVVDQLLEAHTKADFHEKRADELERKLAEAKGQDARHVAELAAARAERDKARAEKDAIIEARSKLAG